MSSLPTTLEQLGERPFSFYPPVVNIEYNEWTFRKATWSEVLVVNSQSAAEIWIPRRYLGAVSRVDEPVAIVGLNKELEFKGGAVWPYQRRVIEMPVAVGDTRGLPQSEPLPPKPSSGLGGDSPDSKMGRMVAGALLVGIVACLVIVTAYRQGDLRSKVVYTGKDQDYLSLVAQDDYYDVVRKLGNPSEERWQSESGELQYRALLYPQRSYIVILMGTNRKQTTYIGTLDSNWHAMHWVYFRSGGTTRSMLEGLRKF